MFRSGPKPAEMENFPSGLYFAKDDGRKRLSDGKSWETCGETSVRVVLGILARSLVVSCKRLHVCWSWSQLLTKLMWCIV